LIGVIMFRSMALDLRKIPRNRHNKTGQDRIDDFADTVERMFEMHECLKDLFSRPLPEKQRDNIMVSMPSDSMDSGYLTIVFSKDGNPLCAYDGEAK